MKRILLDTHAIIWWLAEPELLSKKQFDIISEPSSQVFISAASIWEIRIKESIGKIEVPQNFLDLIKDEGFQFLAINESHADYVSSLPLIHKDPFDRIIIAQAKLEKLSLVTSDKSFEGYEVEII